MDVQINSRLALPDVLKGIAVVLMIQVHLTELFAVPLWLSSKAGQWSLFLGGAPAAPLFMAVMGYFLAKKQPTIMQAMKRGLQLISWGLMLNVGLNMHLLIKIAAGSFQLNPFDYIFGVDILILAGFSVVIIGLWSALAKRNLLLWMLLLVVFAFGNSFIPVSSATQHWSAYLLAVFNGTQTWAYFPLFPWVAYPVAGYIFSLLADTYQKQLRSEKTMLLAAFLLLIPVLAGFEVAFATAVNLPAYYHHSGFFVIWTIGFIALMAIVVRLLTGNLSAGKLSAFLQWLGRNVTSVYVFQWLLIGNLATAIYQTQYPIQLLFWFVTVLGLSVFFTLAWKKKRRAFELRLLFEAKKR